MSDQRPTRPPPALKPPRARSNSRDDLEAVAKLDELDQERRRRFDAELRQNETRAAVLAARLPLEKAPASRQPLPPVAGPVPRQDASPASVSPQVDQAIGRATRAALGKLWPALLAAALGTGGAVAYQRAEAPPERNDRRDAQIADLQRDLADTRTELAKAKGELRAVREWAAEYQAWSMALEASRGVRVRQPEGAPPLPALETSTPLRRRPAAPVLTVQSPPPSPP